jgi:membrane-bound lytic murein transglycosylase B
MVTGTTLLKRAVLAAVLFWPSLLWAGPASANFQSFVQSLWPAAQKRGVPASVFKAAFDGMTPDPDVVGLAHKQPEFKSTSAQYLAKRVSALRIEKGRTKLKEWDEVLAQIEATYGVDRFVVLAVWGNETNFGGFLGGHNALRAMATLAYSGYRADYFKKELLAALDILAQGHTVPENMVGSWAGAMGHTQFMPSSFKAYAVDVTGDGRRDIWTTIPDALASTANYLRVHGWRRGETWGYEVILPSGLNASRAKAMGTVSLAHWMKLGVVRANGQAFPRPADTARLVLPGGAGGPALLVLPNFKVIKRYNNSDNYALAVGYLSDRIRGGDPWVTPFPIDQLLSENERVEMQKLLKKRGFPISKLDGQVGAETRSAIYAFQNETGTAADGMPTPDVLQRLRGPKK